MFVKQIRSTWVRVPDPLRPGKRTQEERLVPTGATAIFHDGKQYESNEKGYFDVPADVAAVLLGRRHPGGERFASAAELNENPEPERRGPGRPRKQHDEDGD